jgi:preprotein translocase subunit SecD
MRRILPFVLVAVGLVALAYAVLPLPRPLGSEPVQTRLGLDLQGGLRGEYQLIATSDQPVTPEALQTSRSIIEQRVNATGVAEPIIQTQGQDRISVEIPGVQNVEQVRDLIGSTGQLEFVPIPTDTQVQQGQQIPPGLEALFTGRELDAAGPSTDELGRPAVEFFLKPEGARLFSEWTSANVGRQFAIVLDDNVVSAPVVETAITGGRGIISGTFTTAEMTNLVTVLKYGALPLAIQEVGFSRISATLGQTFLDQSVLAGAIGIALVFLFMIVHYRLPGVVACLALLFYGVLNLAVFRVLGVTLTLAGVAAFVLSVGMATDANILIFERTKEELRSGKTISAALEAGFNRAWNSILDSNVSSIITAMILFYFGTSTIRGFALVLVIGVLISMFTAITLSREILRWVVRQPWARRAGMWGVRHDEFTVATPVVVRGRSRQAGAGV